VGRRATRSFILSDYSFVSPIVLLASASYGIEAAHRIYQIAPGSRILLASERSDPDGVRTALDEGGRGYLLKSDAGDELLPAIMAVLRGDQFLSNSLKSALSSIANSISRLLANLEQMSPPANSGTAHRVIISSCRNSPGQGCRSNPHRVKPAPQHKSTDLLQF
jgi:DNA-binding NarL/FixJ family response regulator